MANNTHHTKAIILKLIPYGDTSLIITALTEVFGIQSYLIKGVRKPSKTGATKASFFQHAAILNMVVYHHPQKQLNYIKEYNWAILNQNLYTNITKNCIALYLVELLLKCLKQPDDNPELYYFAEDALVQLNQATATITANFALYIALHLPNVLGIQIIDNYTTHSNILDLKDGCYYHETPPHLHIVTEPYSYNISQLLKANHPSYLSEITLNGLVRRQLLMYLETFYQLHIADFGTIKTLPILQEMLY